MGDLLESEKPHQARFKRESGYFSPADGVFQGKPRPFCLPLECAEENLYPGIRQTAAAYFDRHAIKWHQGQNHKPSTHLCDSIACGVGASGDTGGPG